MLEEHRIFHIFLPFAPLYLMEIKTPVSDIGKQNQLHYLCLSIYHILQITNQLNPQDCASFLFKKKLSLYFGSLNILLGSDYDFRKYLGNLIFLYILIKLLCKIWPIFIPQKLSKHLTLVLSLKIFQVYLFAFEK